MEVYALDAPAREVQATLLAEQPEMLAGARAAIYAMIGGGLLAGSALRNPGAFYIDVRASRRPYPAKAIYQAVDILARAHRLLGLVGDQGDEAIPPFPNLGVF